jgi:molybdopterin synthase catalytic subunit
MGLAQMIETMKKDPRYRGMGMIASHLGVVRETSLNGTRVSGIQVTFHQDAIQIIINDIKGMEGIIQVKVETYGGRLNVGDEIMAVVVGGDTREHVFPALMAAVNRIKAEGTSKTEIYES